MGSACSSLAAAWSGSSVAGTAVTVGVPLLAAAAAYVLDEAASEAVAAVPTSLRARSVTRLVVAAVIVGLGALALGAVVLRSGSGAKAGITVQLVGLALVAVAASAAARRRVAEPGEAVGGALLALVLTLALSHPLDRWVSLFPSEPDLRWGGRWRSGRRWPSPASRACGWPPATRWTERRRVSRRHRVPAAPR